jgi:hypothetical protein
MSDRQTSAESQFAHKLAALKDDAARLIPPAEIALYRVIKLGVAAHGAKVTAIETEQADRRTEIERKAARFCILCDLPFDPRNPLDAFRQLPPDDHLSGAPLIIDHRNEETIE